MGVPPDSTVTGVSVSSSTVGVNTSVNVTVTGGNPCGAVQINFGDGQAPYLPISALPYGTSHSWDTAGTYTITASGQGNCGGQASTSITVTGEAPAAVASMSADETSSPPGAHQHLTRTRVNERRLSVERFAVEGAEDPDASELTPVPSERMSLAAPVTVTLDIAAGATGTVTSSPSGFNCSGSETTCTASFEASTSVTLTATPSSGNTFVGWGGACTGTSTCVITATAGQLVTAAFTNAAATISYYHTDTLGSVRAITSSSGSTVTRHDYAPFGENTSSLSGDPRRFLGQEQDAETALDHFGARYYRNVWGRFTSVDPYLSPVAMADPQRWNRYSYALNAPLSLVDPTGLDPEDPDETLLEDGERYTADYISSLGRRAWNDAVDAWLESIEERNIALRNAAAPQVPPPSLIQPILNGLATVGRGIGNALGRFGNWLGGLFGGGGQAAVQSAATLINGSAAAGGHIVSRHVAQTGAQLATRLTNEPKISAASTFNTLAEAQKAVQAALTARATELGNWVAAGAHRDLVLQTVFNGGTVLQRVPAGQTPVPMVGTGVTVVLRGAGNGTYFLLTGYPTR